MVLLGDDSPWTLAELVRELSDDNDTVDAVNSLYGAGLVHRLGDFVLPTRAARRADELYDGAL